MLITGGHFLFGHVEAGVHHFEEGVGFGRFPVATPDLTTWLFGYLEVHYDPRGDFDHYWIGTGDDNLASHRYFAFEWSRETEVWTPHILYNEFFGLYERSGHLKVSRAPGTNTVYVVARPYGVGSVAIARYKNSTWELLRPSFNWSGNCYPWAIDENNCVYISSATYGGGPGYFTATYLQYPSGVDLPDEGFRGVTQLGDGTLFLLSNSGNVYSAPDRNGPFTLDNPSTNFGTIYGTAWGSCLACSADGLTLVVQQRGGVNYWVRRGYDDWVDVGPTGAGYDGAPAAISDQVLLAGNWSDGSRLSVDGGTTWQNTSVNGSCGSFLDEISSRKMLAQLKSVYWSANSLWCRGESAYSPWSFWGTYKTPMEDYDVGNSRISIQGFSDEHIVVGFHRSTDYGPYANAIHYDPETDSWSKFYFENFYGSVGNKLWVYGTAYEAGKLHGIISNGSYLHYTRWNGTDYDVTAIPGSTSTGGRLNIHANNSGQEIWVTAPGNQLFNSTDSGVSWTNKYSEASAIHASPDEAVDVIIVTGEVDEVYVSFTAVGGGTVYFSKWNGSSWVQAAPDFSGNAGERSIFIDGSGYLWFFESEEVSGAPTIQKLIGGVWVEQAGSSFSGLGNITGIDAFDDNMVMAASVDTHLIGYPTGDGQMFSTCTNDNLGWIQRTVNVDYMPIVADVSIWGSPLDTTPPWLENTFPSSIANKDTLVSFDVIDDFGVVKESIDAYVDGQLAFSESTFLSPYDGPSSSISTTNIDGYDGYHVVLDNTLDYSNGSNYDVRVLALDTSNNSLDDTWNFEIVSTISSINKLYYSDDLGVYKINIENLVGESQSAVELFLNETTTPSIPTSKVDYLSGKFIDGHYYLILSMNGLDTSVDQSIWGEFVWGEFTWSATNHGVAIIDNEAIKNVYADAYSCDKAQMTSDGTLYLVNRTLNRIEVYYGANIRSGEGRVPDYIYDGYSTPSLYNDGYNIGTINTIYVADGQSNVLSGGSRVYVGQSIGMTIIDTYDKSTNGYSDGLDNLGTSSYCGIVGSGATHECIGGTISNVTDITTDERYDMILIVTNDGNGNGGLTQTTISGLVKLIFMTEETGLVPSNDIRNVSKYE